LLFVRYIDQTSMNRFQTFESFQEKLRAVDSPYSDDITTDYLDWLTASIRKKYDLDTWYSYVASYNDRGISLEIPYENEQQLADKTFEKIPSAQEAFEEIINFLNKHRNIHFKVRKVRTDNLIKEIRVISVKSSPSLEEWTENFRGKIASKKFGI